MKDNKKVIAILTIFTIIFTILGGSLAYWTWDSEVRSNLVFTLSKDFSCSADGGESINTNEVILAPTKLMDDENGKCINNDRAIKREIKVNPTIKKSGLSINMNMWLYINYIDKELSDSEHLKYILTTNENSCEKGIVSKGSFNGSAQGSKLNLFSNKQYSYGYIGPDTYYLWIWLDAEENNNNTMNKEFDLSLGGECTDSPYIQAEKPVLDDGMIPVTIANDGTVSTVDSRDSSWYDYTAKKWANVVLVKDNATTGVSGSHSRTYYLNNLYKNEIVAPEDILAYYVWIPRYKYRQSAVSCGDIKDEITKESHPECFAGPYKVSDEDYEKLYNYFYDYISKQDRVDAGCTEMYIYTEEENIFDSYDGRFDFPCSDDSWPVFISKKARISVDFLLENISYDQYYNYGNYTMEYGYVDYVRSEDYYSDLLNITFDDLRTNREYYFDIKFENATDMRVISYNDNEYMTHPAFWWDSDEDGNVDNSEMLPGIWVGKFETTGRYSAPTVLPNNAPLVNQTISNQFNTSLNFTKSGNTYGLSNVNTNSHMMKNSEWGAVAYLSASRYGKYRDIVSNNYYNYDTGLTMTGCGGVSYNFTSNPGYGGDEPGYHCSPGSCWHEENVSSECSVQYGKSTLYSQSTTGNIYGIFDMSGGVYEYVMGNYDKVISSSGLSADKFNLKGTYINIYNEGSDSRGHALSETEGWYGDQHLKVTALYPWYVRGGYYGSDQPTEDSGIFSYINASGVSASNRGFRMTIINGVPAYNG